MLCAAFVKPGEARACKRMPPWPSAPPAGEAKKAAALHKIQGKARVLPETGTQTDAALNAGDPHVCRAHSPSLVDEE